MDATTGMIVTDHIAGDAGVLRARGVAKSEGLVQGGRGRTCEGR